MNQVFKTSSPICLSTLRAEVPLTQLHEYVYCKLFYQNINNKIFEGRPALNDSQNACQNRSLKEQKTVLSNFKS